MTDFLAKFDGGELIALVAVAGAMLVAMVGIVAIQWRRVRIAELEASLKQQMLEKGMAAAEIELVMKASQAPANNSASSTGNEAMDKAALVQRMVDNGYEGADIERVLRAYQPSAKSADEKVGAGHV